MQKDLRSRIHQTGVSQHDLEEVVRIGQFPTIEKALDHLDACCPPLADGPIAALSRIKEINYQIDQALFAIVTATSAWTWCDDLKLAFVLMGPEGRGFVLQRAVKEKIPFRLQKSYKGGIRFLRFHGDIRSERINKDGYRKQTLMQKLAGKLRTNVPRTVDMLEKLVRTCDDPSWHHTTFPFVHRAARLDNAHRLLRKHKLIIHHPVQPLL